MIRHLIDPANAITVSGLALSVASIHLAMANQANAAVAVALWALLADHLDGVVAARTPGRVAETAKIGKSLDSLADLVSAGIFPGVLLAVLAQGAAWATVVAVALAIASALRLSCFNTFGLSGDCFTGVPTTYVLPLTAAIFLIRPLAPDELFAPLLGVALLSIAGLHLSPIQVPRTSGGMYIVVTLYCASSSILLAVQGR